MRTTLYNAILLTPEVRFRGGVCVENGRISSIFRDDTFERMGTLIDCGGNYLAPGFVDVHNHGTVGGSFFTADPAEMERAAVVMAEHGATAVLPTSASASHEDTLRFLRTVAALQGHNRGAKLLGAHLEGNYLNPAFSGAQNPAFLYPPREREYMALIDTGVVRRVSCSPEIPGVLDMARRLVPMGIQLSMAHSGADHTQVLAAMDAGFDHITHIYNAISFLSNCYFYPKTGACEAALLYDGITVEAICDGRHLPPELLRLIYRCKGADRMHAVTDAVLAGAPSGRCTLFGMDCVVEDQVCMLADRSAFAGSVATPDRLLSVLYHDAGIPLTDAVKMVSLTPARQIHAAGIGRLAEGYAADLNVFNDRIDILYTMIDGAVFCDRLTTRQ